MVYVHMYVHMYTRAVEVHNGHTCMAVRWIVMDGFLTVREWDGLSRGWVELGVVESQVVRCVLVIGIVFVAFFVVSLCSCCSHNYYRMDLSVNG